MLTEQAVKTADRSQIHIGPPGALGLKALDPEGCSKIHQANLELLQKTGIVVTSKNAQAGFEALLTALPAALAGANLIYGTGMVDSGMTLDYGKLVVDDEINRAIIQVVKGFEVNTETLSLDLIEEVGHKGNYLTHSSTYEHCKDFISPNLMDRDTYESWTSKGESSLHARALEHAKQVVENHRPTPISQQAQKEIDEIIRETEKEFGVSI